MIQFTALLLASFSSNISVDTVSRTPISPYIYGANHPDWDKMPSFYTVARQGGNRMSAFNWETNASNAGNDYRHQNDGYMGETNEAGFTPRVFMQNAQARSSATILTVPCMGYVSADKGPDNDVNRTPNYLQTRFHRSLAKKPGGKFIFPPNVTDKFVYQDEFVSFIERTKRSNAPVWYSLDNEPDLWGSTHQRVWAQNPTYAQIAAINIDYAKGIKAVAPKSLVFGPANYGWQGFRTFQNAPDQNGRDFLDFYLDAMRKAEQATGKRLIDVLDIHWYPEAQGDGTRIVMGGEKDTPGLAQARIQAPRSLWDPTYVEKSWISDSIGKKPIVLLPGVKRQIQTHYPGTKFGITEYDFGGGQFVSGLLAQADVLGIYGQQGIFAACHWGVEPKRPATIGGFLAYRDYDGKGSRFGDLGLAVSGTVPAEESVYASLDRANPSKLTLVAINKTKRSRNINIALQGFVGKTAKGWVRNSASFQKPIPVTVKLRGSSLNFALAAESVITVEVRR